MQRNNQRNTLLIVILCVCLALVSVVFLISMRTRRQAQSGMDISGSQSTPTPTPTPTPATTPTPTPALTPTPTPEITPFYDVESISPGDRGTLVAVVQARLHQLGYYYYKPTGYFAEMTKTALMQFQTANGLVVDGIASEQTLTRLFGHDAKRAEAAPTASPVPTPPIVRPRDYGEPMTNDEVNTLIPVGSQFLVVDLNSQMYFTARRVGGANHMEIVPANQKEVDRFTNIFAGLPKFSIRPCVIEFGDHIIAASLNGQPHGKQVTDYGFDGTLCLYFFGSKAENSNLTDAAHEASLLIASNGMMP